MSMPSSSDEVATRQGSWPDLSISSTTRRSSWASEPWWARATSIDCRRNPPLRVRFRRVSWPAVLSRGQLLLGLLVRELVQALRQALGAAAGVDEDDRRGVLADQLEQLRVDRRPDRAGIRGARRIPARRPRRWAAGARRRARVMSSTGTWIFRSSSFLRPASTISTSRRGPTRNLPITSSGRWVAESPIRCGSSPPASTTWSDETQLHAPLGVTATRGPLFVIADTDNQRVRQVGPAPLETTQAPPPPEVVISCSTEGVWSCERLPRSLEAGVAANLGAVSISHEGAESAAGRWLPPVGGRVRFLLVEDRPLVPGSRLVFGLAGRGFRRPIHLTQGL